MNVYPKITVVTPNYNQEKFIEQTIQSVINQDYPNLEYIIMDGGSTDGSVDIIKKYAKNLSHWESSKDRGMYDAINKGFLRSTGEILCWINSDDLLAEGALKYVAEIFTKDSQVKWLMGLPTLINEVGEVTWQGQDAKVFSPYFFYLHNHMSTFSFIQQESTFWSRSLWMKTGGNLSLDLSLASDFDLWMRFFRYEKLYFSKKQLAAFRRRSGQLSENKDTYVKETNISTCLNQKKLSVKDKLVVFGLKSTRKLFFGLKNKRIKNLFYVLQEKVFGQPNWVD